MEARDRTEIPALLDTLRTSDDPDQRRLAAESLSQIAHTAGHFPELLEPFLGLLENESEEIANCAVSGLQAQSPKNPPLATHLLVSALPRFPALAVVAGHWQVAQAAPLLRELAKSSDRFQSAQAVEALARLGDRASLSLLAKTLTQSNAPAAARMMAAQALGRQAGPEAQAALRKALSSCKVDQDGEVLIAVVRALAAPALAHLAPALLEFYGRVSSSRLKRKPSDFLARHDFMAYFYNLAREVLLALKGSSLPAAQELLRQELQSPHAPLRRQAADSLSVLGGSEQESDHRSVSLNQK